MSATKMVGVWLLCFAAIQVADAPGLLFWRLLATVGVAACGGWILGAAWREAAQK